MKNPIAIAGVLLSTCLIACAPKSTARWDHGIALANQTQARGSMPAARTVRAETKCVLKSQGRTMRFETILVADSSRGRIEAIGPFGMSLATILWQDSTWQVWLPAQGALVRGTGDSMSLPVVGLRSLRPKELVGPYLGRPLPIRSGIPLRTMNPPGGASDQAVVLPSVRAPAWSATLDRSTGLPRILQLMRDQHEVERIRFGAWRERSGTPVPDSMVRTGTEGQELTMILTQWTPLESFPQDMMSLSLPAAVDTIVVVHDGTGRQHYRVRPAAGSSLTESAAESLLGTDSTEVEEEIDDPASTEEEGDEDPEEQDDPEIAIP